MKSIKRFNQILEDNSSKNKNEDILMYFTDYYDSNINKFSIKDVLVYENRVIEDTSYIKDPSKYRKAKLIKIEVRDFKGGISIDGKKTITSLNILQDLLSDIERFYSITGEEINYIINTDYIGLRIEFLVVGEYMKESDNKVKLIDSLSTEFKNFFKKMGFRPSIKGSLIEIKTISKKRDSIYGDYSTDLKIILERIKNGDINLDNLENLSKQSYRELVEWRNKVYENGLDIDIYGGDHQVLVKLKKRNE